MRQAVLPFVLSVAIVAGCNKQAPSVVQAEEQAVNPVEVIPPTPFVISQPFQNIMEAETLLDVSGPLPEWSDKLEPELSKVENEIKKHVEKYNWWQDKEKFAIGAREGMSEELQAIREQLRRAATYTKAARRELPKMKEAQRVRDIVAAGETYVGMPWWALVGAVGNPDDMNRTRSEKGESSQWVYRKGPIKYAYLNGDGVVTAIQD
ncbi:hypothetical protein ACXR0O_25480 [Verrucomicrobiota bacterium sgz303538]